MGLQLLFASLVSFGPMPLLKKSHPLSICGIADQSVTAVGSRQSTTWPHVFDIVIQCSLEVLCLPPPLVVAPLYFTVRQLLEYSSAIHFPHPSRLEKLCCDSTAPMLVDWPLSSIVWLVIQPPRKHTV